ncbi:CDP-alcohol phosphatidyltransferase [Lipomyces orientalis]|uniref:CDP-alcohol phosphatidyltransferase n=1 Tax=Lipomyces orientalis TaxID=1233043 RepID=A0ACC3TFH0_9ASCO
MFDITLRRFKDRLVEPVARIVPPWVSPDLVTLAAFVFGLSSCYTAAFSDSSTWPVFLWLVNRALDSLDGTLARQRATATELGGFLDLLGDFIVYSLIPIAIAYGQDLRPTNLPLIDDNNIRLDWRSVAVLEATFHINNFILFYIPAVAVKQPRGNKELTSVAMLPALVEGFESGLIFTAMLVWRRFVGPLCLGMSAAVAIGIVQRVWYLAGALKRVDRTRSKST